MEFKETSKKYNEYLIQEFFYSGVESNMRDDNEILRDQTLLSNLHLLEGADNPFNLKDVKLLGFEHDESIDLTRLNWLLEIREIYEVELKKYIDDEVYFYGCSFKVYEKKYPTRLKEFQEKCIDATEIDFIKDEYIEVGIDNLNFEDINIDFTLNESNEYYLNKRYSLTKRSGFLKLKMAELGYKVKYYEEDTSSYYDDFTTMTKKYSIIEKQAQNDAEEKTIHKEIIAVDLCETRATEKIIMLYKLGVFEFLKTKEPFNLSTNALASAISGITGINVKTVQSYINPIGKTSVDQKNNPLMREKVVNKISQKLISIGYKPQD
jgi:hypothetical protein